MAYAGRADQSYRRRQRDETQSREVPAPPRSAGEVRGHEATTSGVTEAQASPVAGNGPVP